MRNIFVFVICSIFVSLGCQNDNELTDVNIRVKNTDTVVIESFSLNFDTILFENVELGKTTEYRTWPNEYRPDTFEVKTERGTFGPVIYEYVGEAFNIEEGLYTIELDGSNSFGLVKDK